MMLKPIGFLQEDFHSEVLDFLFEIVSDMYPTRQMILYNNFDRYNNKNTYIKKYSNLVNYGLDKFIPDLIDNVCENIIVISYDNILNISLLKKYMSNFIFIAHSEKHVTIYNMLGLTYFSLTPMLSNVYMTPFIKKANQYITQNEITISNLESFKQRQINEDLTFMITVGQFLLSNKDIDLLDNLLSSKRIILIVYTNFVSKELYELLIRYQNYIYVSKNTPNEQILTDIKALDIKYILFAPPENSDFYKSSWSGTISFAFDNDLWLIMPKLIADKYSFKDDVIGYTNKDDILLHIQNHKNDMSYKDSLTLRRTSVYERNKIVWNILYNTDKPGNATSNIKKYKIEHHLQNEIILYETLFCQIPKLQSKLYNKTIIDINLDISLFSIICFIIQPELNKIINIIKDTNNIETYRNFMIYNDLIDRTKIYNDNVLENMELNEIDSNVVALMHMSSDEIKNMKGGTRLIIEKNKPVLLIRNDETDETKIYTHYLKNLGYENVIISNYNIYYIKD